MSAVSYVLIFRLNDAAEVAKRREFTNDSNAMSAAREELEQYAKLGQRRGSVSLGRDDGFAEPTWLGSWDYDPAGGFTWAGVAASGA